MRSTLPCFLLATDLPLRNGAGQPRRFGQSAGRARQRPVRQLVNQVLKRPGGPQIAKIPGVPGKAAAPHAKGSRLQPNFERNVADLTDRNRSGLNRLSKDGLHSDLMKRQVRLP